MFITEIQTEQRVFSSFPLGNNNYISSLSLPARYARSSLYTLTLHLTLVFVNPGVPIASLDLN